jgi:hypothetical protein
MKEYVHFYKASSPKEKKENYKRLLKKNFNLSSNCGLTRKATACNSLSKETLQRAKEREAS